MTLLFSNNAETTLAAGITAEVTAMSVVPTKGALFNQAVTVDDVERVTLTDGVNFEVVEITNWATDDATIVREVEGTARIWPVGTLVSSRVTAGILAAIQQVNKKPALYKDVLHIPNTTTVLDLAAAYPNPDDMPSLIWIDYGLNNDLLTITLPPIAGLNKAYMLDIVKPVIGTKLVHVYADAAEYIDNVLGDYMIMNFSTHFQVVGYNGRWDGGFI